METISLNPESVAAYKELLTNPAANKLPFKVLSEIFKESDVCIPKHILFKQYIDRIKAPLPKIMFYIIMDDVYAARIAKAETGELGYKLELTPE